MKNSAKISAVIAVVGVFSAASIYQMRSRNKHSLDYAMNLYGFKTPEQKEAFKNLLQMAGVALQKSYSTSSFLRSSQNQLAEDILNLVKTTQQHFTIRTGTQERWETQSRDWMLKNRSQIFDNLKTLGFVEEITPKVENLDAICILGATRKRMAIRVGYAEKLISNHIKARHLIFLVGERYVTADVDATEKELSALAAKFSIPDWKKLTETHLARELYSRSFLSKTDISASIIDTPRGDLPRPTTQTTVLSLAQWLSEHPDVKKIALISNQPYVRYQQAVISAVLHENRVNVDFKVIGSAARQNYDAKSLLEGFGSYILATTPAVLSSLNLQITDDEIKRKFIELYSGNPLIFKGLPENIKEMDRSRRLHL